MHGGSAQTCGGRLQCAIPHLRHWPVALKGFSNECAMAFGDSNHEVRVAAWTFGLNMESRSMPMGDIGNGGPFLWNPITGSLQRGTWGRAEMTGPGG